MPRIDLGEFRESLFPDLPGDAISEQGVRRGLRRRAAWMVLVLALVLVVPGIRIGLRLPFAAAAAAIILVLVVLARYAPATGVRFAWAASSGLLMGVIVAAMILDAEAGSLGLLAFAVMVSANAAVAGLGAGLITAALSTALATLAWVLQPDLFVNPGITLTGAAVGYTIIATSVETFTRERRHAARQLTRLHGALRAASAEPGLDATLNSLVGAVDRAFGARATVVLLQEADHLVLAAPRSDPPSVWSDDDFARATAQDLTRPDSSPLSYAMSTGETVVLVDVAQDTRFPDWSRRWLDLVGRFGLRSTVVIPLRSGASTVGLLQVCFSGTGGFDSDDVVLLEAYAEQASVIILRAQAYAELEAADALKSEFLATVSHELRTPLTAAKGFVDTVLLQWDRLDDEPRRQLLRRASANADELARLIDQLLDYSRLDTGTVRLLPAETELAPLVEGLVARMAPVLDGHVVTVAATEGLPVLVDRDAFAHVLGNLLTNAANFSPAGSSISVTTCVGDGCALVSVHDDGIGIAQEEHERIFERFYRVRDDSGAGRGTGIGLAIASRFVELLGGRISVESAPGDGSTFTFTVPLGGRLAQSYS
jgi:signal transduction histidine kinase